MLPNHSMVQPPGKTVRWGKSSGTRNRHVHGLFGDFWAQVLFKMSIFHH
jgi:hypothetical protein